MTSAGCESFKGSLWTLDLMMYLDLKCLECSKVLKRGETDIIVSASREFKEMLKAAFVTPYKFYDGDAITTTRDASLENTSSSEVHQNTNPALSTGPGRVEQRVIDQQKQIMLKRWSFW